MFELIDLLTIDDLDDHELVVEALNGLRVGLSRPEPTGVGPRTRRTHPQDPVSSQRR